MHPAGRPARDHHRPAQASTYIIGSGDQLGVFVYQSPQLSEEAVSVRPDGKISIPLVQDIQAAGLTPAQLADNIAHRLTEYVKDPRVTVIVKTFVGPLDQQIKVIGEAALPQAIPYRDGLRDPRRAGGNQGPHQICRGQPGAGDQEAAERADTGPSTSTSTT